MFSKRTEWNNSPNRLARLIAEKRRVGRTVIDLTESNPTKCGFSYPEQGILKALSNPSVLSYRPEPFGLLKAREAVAEFYSGQFKIIPENIILTSGTSEAYSHLFKLLCDAGDEILVPQPSYPLFEYLCQINDIKPCNYRLGYDGEWHIDFDFLEKQITERTRAIVLVHPNNPTGSYYKQDEYDRILSLASGYNFSIITDEVFEPYEIEPDNRRAHFSKTQPRVLHFSLNGISKLIGLPQLKLSWIIACCNSPNMTEALKRLEIINDTFLSVNTPVQLALPELLHFSANIQDQIRSRIRNNYALLQNMFSDSNASVLRTEGGWSAILQLPLRKSDEKWVELILEKEDIFVQPGHFYDFEQESCIVFSLLLNMDIFTKSLEKIFPLIQEN